MGLSRIRQGEYMVDIKKGDEWMSLDGWGSYFKSEKLAAKRCGEVLDSDVNAILRIRDYLGAVTWTNVKGYINE